MKKCILLFCLIISFQSCDISKRALKNKTDRQLNEQTETITKRKGDTVSYIVPKITYKDTTIVKKNYVTGTTQVVRYDDQGYIDKIDCISGAMEEITRTNRELIEIVKDKESEKTETFDSAIIIYIMLGFALIVFIVAFLGFRMLNQNASTIKIILDKIS